MTGQTTKTTYKAALYCRLSRDDGYSGTNFQRPSFQRMIADIESGKTNSRRSIQTVTDGSLTGKMTKGVMIGATSAFGEFYAILFTQVIL